MQSTTSSHKRQKLSNESQEKSLINNVLKKYQRLYKCKKKLPEYREFLRKWDPSIIQPVVTDIPPTPKRNDVLSEVPENLRKYYHIASHDTFLYHLNKSWKKALDAIKDEPYGLLYVSPTDNIKSEHWVAGLLLHHNPTFQPLSPPKRNYNLDDKEHYDLDFSNVIQKPKHYVVVDDAAYSGEQIYINLCETIDQLYDALDIPLNIHVVIPFMSHDAKKNIENIYRDNSIKISLYSSAIIIHVDEQKSSMSDNEKKYVASHFLNFMTIFSHKQADDISLGKAAKDVCGSVALYSKPETRKTFIEYLEEGKNKK